MYKKIVICGNYGATNLGDEAILESIINSIRRMNRQAEITVLSANPRETAQKYNVKAAHLFPTGPRSIMKRFLTLQIIKTLRIIRNCDLFILGGGGLFTDEKPRAIWIWGAHALLVISQKRPIYMCAQSVGPLNTKKYQEIVRHIFNQATAITVRDQESKDLLDLIDVRTKIKVTADPALLLDFPESTRRGRYAIMSIRPWPKTPSGMYKKLAQYIDWLYAHYQIKTVLLPFQKGIDDDYSTLKKIQKQVANKNSVQLEAYADAYADDHEQHARKLYAEAELVIGMRLHSLIFAALSKTPLVGLSYSPKVRNFLASINQEQQAIDLGNFETPQALRTLKDLTEEALNHGTSQDAQKALQQACEQAKENEKILREFL